MSRFSRTQPTPRRISAPQASHLHIEYSAGVFRDVRLESTIGGGFGLLFGTRRGDQVTVLAACHSRTGLEPVGLFITRAKEDLSLCAEDIAAFDSARVAGAVILVIAGGSGGFFARTAAGAIEAIEAHEVDAPVAQAAPSMLPRRWLWVGLGCLMLGTLAIAAPAYLRPRSSPGALGLSVREVAGQLQIGWSVAAKPVRLDIVDGSEHRSISVFQTMANATYARQTGDVKIRLVGVSKDETARFVGGDSPAQTASAEARQDIAILESLVRKLRVSAQTRRERVAELSRTTKFLRELSASH
jgi:hypothetical protein